MEEVRERTGEAEIEGPVLERCLEQTAQPHYVSGWLGCRLGKWNVVGPAVRHPFWSHSASPFGLRVAIPSAESCSLLYFSA